ncbi:MAG: transposase [Moraxellaceae bacterium]|nr:transposase [Moraxellaceae bacterium]
MGYALGELVERLVKMLLQRAVLHADETPVQQLDPKAKLSGTKKAYLWAYRSNSWTRKTLSWYLIIKVIEKVVMYVRF